MFISNLCVCVFARTEKSPNIVTLEALLLVSRHQPFVFSLCSHNKSHDEYCFVHFTHLVSSSTTLTHPLMKHYSMMNFYADIVDSFATRQSKA